MPDNVVSRLQQRIVAGEVALNYDSQRGWLPSVLDHLGISPSSQMLVFSKTSMQRQRIAPNRPRALYFNDDVYVGYCQNGGVIEISAADPQLGAVFYTIDQQAAEKPQITRQTDNCLSCHASSSHTGGVPGQVVRSLFCDSSGLPILSAGSHRIDQTSPIKNRWGGWYVTGTHGSQTHLGNLIVTDKSKPELADVTPGMNLTELGDRFDAGKYLTPHSDIVALMVFEHQTGMHNRIAQANYATRRALFDEKVMDDAFKEPTDQLRESTVRRIENAAEPLVQYLLFSGEAPITHRITGTSGFAEHFAAQGVRDEHGRSLRDLDLEHRLFKYPCSYLIYGEAFDALPDVIRIQVWKRMWEILNGQDASGRYQHLSEADRRAILEILVETKTGLPDCWRLPGDSDSAADKTEKTL